MQEEKAMDNRIELLAPAGEWDAFVAAVENGADAVYLGGRQFNARQFAGNFDSEKLNVALDYAHVRRVKVYLALNTLILDSEMGQAAEVVEEAWQMGIDGVIVQDLGLAALLRERLPGLPLHASTQMTIHNLDGVKVLEDLGFQRVVLARELTLEEIRFIAENTKLEVEVFVHGALCVCYSGQCLMSSIIGGRSGNRGKCAQPCRLPYELVSGNGKSLGIKSPGRYLLSPKDMCSIYEQGDLIKAGVKSLKIEGRMKNPEYVATVVKTYRKQLDSLLGVVREGAVQQPASSGDVQKLMQIFNRGGMSSGYLHGSSGREGMSYEKPKNWGIRIGEVISYNRNQKTVKLRLEEDLGMGDGVEIWNGENESPGNVVSVIQVSGRNQSAAHKGDIVEIGEFQGRISAGNPVYKTSDKGLNAAARESYSGKFRRKAWIHCKVMIPSDEPVRVKVWDDAGNQAEAVGDVLPEPALNRALTQERVEEQIRKTGATPFAFQDLEVELEEGLAVPVSELNQVRRRALEELERKIIASHKHTLPAFSVHQTGTNNYFPGNSRIQLEKIRIAGLFYRMPEEPNDGNLELDRIYLPLRACLEAENEGFLEAIRSSGCELYTWIPSILKGNAGKFYRHHLKKAASAGIQGCLVGNPGALSLVREIPQLAIACDSTMNCFNSLTADALEKEGARSITLSMELNLDQIADLHVSGQLNKEVAVYGRIPVMTSEYCPVGSVAGGKTRNTACSRPCAKGDYGLKDRLGMTFPVLCDPMDCRTTIFNSQVLFAPDSLDKLGNSGVSMIRLNFTDEKPEEIRGLIEVHRAVLDQGVKALSRYTAIVEGTKAKGITKGHFFRGV